jgi:hypothetical protein
MSLLVLTSLTVSTLTHFIGFVLLLAGAFFGFKVVHTMLNPWKYPLIVKSEWMWNIAALVPVMLIALGIWLVRSWISWLIANLN